jgi:DHA2 family multidrug resistance protein
MSGAAIEANDFDAPNVVSANPWLIAALVALATFMEVLDITVANVALRYIAGGMGVSEDEASWVVTTYLVANAVALTASSFLARLLGRKTFFLVCLALFTASSVLCGFAWSLDSLLLFRILQGIGGGGMVPVSQSILADSFPPSKRGQAFALFGVAIVVAPIVGPTLGGWLSDNYSWQWCFLINGPVGLIAIALIALILREPEAATAERKRLQQQGAAFDLVGFVLVATFLGTLELVLDRGLEDDWFGSSFIVAASAICALAFVLMIPWEISRRRPMIDLRILATRQYGACFLVMLATGALLIGTTQFLPQLVQQDFGYTATWAGLVLSPGGVVTMMMMAVAGRLVGKVQPKYLIVAGAVIIALSLYALTNVYGDLGFWFMARGTSSSMTQRWREVDSNPRSPGYGGARFSWRRATRPMPPRNADRSRRRVRRAISACPARLSHGKKPASSSRSASATSNIGGAFSPSRQRWKSVGTIGFFTRSECQIADESGIP